MNIMQKINVECVSSFEEKEINYHTKFTSLWILQSLETILLYNKRQVCNIFTETIYVVSFERSFV